jgi:hypothetical protein
MSRHFTALKGGVVVRRGMFTDEECLRIDFPAPEYELLLDEYRDFPPPKKTYQDERRMAYPPLSEFADAMYWQAQGDSSKMEAYMAAVDAVKAQFPKSN